MPKTRFDSGPIKKLAEALPLVLSYGNMDIKAN